MFTASNSVHPLAGARVDIAGFGSGFFCTGRFRCRMISLRAPLIGGIGLVSLELLAELATDTDAFGSSREVK